MIPYGSKFRTARSASLHTPFTLSPPNSRLLRPTCLVSCHGAMPRQLAIALAWQTNAAWHTELNAQLYRESEFVSLLLRATSWTPDPELMFLLPSWEAAWLP